ncbi:MAG: aldehyde dehydrogenase [Gammaproteobacteria bacterium]|nr:aldehyde dehydrogenase [Gammaproteobacteria bacterium]
MKKKVGINGFGRIGRVVSRINQTQNKFDLAAVNDINPYIDNMAYLLKYDSTYGKFPVDVISDDKSLFINGMEVRYFSERDISQVDWDSLGIDLVIDSSGLSSNVLSAKKLVKESSVQKVIVTHSSEHVDKEIILGINDDTLTSNDNVVSNSICDANAIAHILKWIDDEYGIETGSVTTLHPWLSYQNLVDGPSISQSNPGVVWKDYALGRASVDSILPKNTTAVTAVQKVMPHLQGKLMSFSYRVPTDIVASSDITLKPNISVDQRELEAYLLTKIEQSLYVRANTDSLVSLDYEKEEASAVVDLQWLKSENGLIKIVLWYDNEWGYSARVLDLAEKLLDSV